MVIVKKHIIVDEGIKIGLDHSSDLTFVSHAHADHNIKGKVFCSKPTKDLLVARYNRPPEDISEKLHKNVELIDAGHILGSRALFYKGNKKVLYTGDFIDKERLFLKGFKAKKADILIIESTFGKPEYVFPEPKQVLKDAFDWVEDELRKGNSVAALGYSLGKGQLLARLFEKLDYPIYIHGSMLKMNRVYSQHGVDLDGFMTISKARKGDYLDKFPFVAIAPPNVELKLGNVKRAMFSGWARDIAGYDMAFPLSDHADYNGLIETVEKVSPEKVYVTHGFEQEFSEELIKKGFDAEPI